MISEPLQQQGLGAIDLICWLRYWRTRSWIPT